MLPYAWAIYDNCKQNIEDDHSRLPEVGQGILV